MEHKIIKLDEIEYHGYKVQVNIDKIDEVDFVGLWKNILVETENATKKDSEFYIGLEDYSTLTKDNRCFNYYAMAPSNYYDETNNSQESRKIESGKYIVFSNKLKTHGPSFFKKVYEYIKVNNINVDYSYDFEIVTNNFDRNNEDSDIFLALKLK